jgi:hypothetical protein
LTVAGAGQKSLLVGLDRYRSLRLLHFTAALIHMLTLNHQWNGWARNVRYRTYMPAMTESSRRYGVTITVDRDRVVAHLPNPAEFAVAAEQAASARAACIVSAHTASQIVSIVTVLAADQPVAVALAVASDALKRPVASPVR